MATTLEQFLLFLIVFNVPVNFNAFIEIKDFCTHSLPSHHFHKIIDFDFLCFGLGTPAGFDQYNRFRIGCLLLLTCCLHLP